MEIILNNQQKITIFPGTFNPIHIAHLIIAETARSQFNLKEIIFITANIPPHRSINIAPAIDRYNMVKFACEENPYFHVSDLELKRDGPSYTVDTVLEIKNTLSPSEKINMIIGADAISMIDTWNGAQEIINNTNFLIIPRPGCPDVPQCLLNTGLDNYSYQIINSPFMDISSTRIRDNINQGNSIRYLVTEPVRKYIEDNATFR